MCLIDSNSFCHSPSLSLADIVSYLSYLIAVKILCSDTSDEKMTPGVFCTSYQSNQQCVIEVYAANLLCSEWTFFVKWEYLRHFHFMESVLVFISSPMTATFNQFVDWLISLQDRIQIPATSDYFNQAIVLYVVFHRLCCGWRMWEYRGEPCLSQRKSKKVRKDAHRQLILCRCMCFVAFSQQSSVSPKELGKSPAKVF